MWVVAAGSGSTRQLCRQRAASGSTPEVETGWRPMAGRRARADHEGMPTKATMRRVRRQARRGKRPTTQAGEFVRENMREMKRGSGNVRSRKQAIAIGLSEARRAGVKLRSPSRGKVSADTKRKAERDAAIGAGRKRPSRSRSQGAKKAAATRERRYGRRSGGARMTRTRRRW